jgi:hypothetical protein
MAEARVALRKIAPQPEAVDDKLPPMLVSSRWTFSDRHVAGCNLAVMAQGFGPGEMVWQTAPNARYRVTAERGGRTLASETATADSAGRLRLRLAAAAQEPLELRLQCHD